jgi:hypothetical protein
MAYAVDFSGAGKQICMQAFYFFLERSEDARVQWNEQVVKRPWNVDRKFDSFHENDCPFGTAHVWAICQHQCTSDIFFSLTRRNHSLLAFT